MLCYEIWLNGERLFVAGHKDAITLEARVLFHRKHTEQFLGVSSIVGLEGQRPKDFEWDTPLLGIGDEVRIKLVESDSPIPPQHELPFGVRLPPPWGDNDAGCSFCGGSAAERKMLFDGPSVRICDACIEFRHEIIANASSSAA